MADKLEWMNKHLVLLRYISVADAAARENYRIPDEEAETFAGVNSGEDAAFRLAEKGNCKAACELFAYVAHRRAGIWWGYRCILSLLEELKINPAEERDIADIGANLEVEVPDWAKVELPPPPDMSPIQALTAELKAQNAEIVKDLVEPEFLKYVQDAVEVAFQEFKRVHGIHPIDLLKKLGERINEDPYKIDPNSPVFKAERELKAQLAPCRRKP